MKRRAARRLHTRGEEGAQAADCVCRACRASRVGGRALVPCGEMILVDCL